MFNVTVINVKKTIMKLSIFIATIVIAFFATTVVNTLKTSEILQINISEELIKCLNNEIPAIESTYYQANNMIKEDEKEEEIEETIIGKILSIELSKIQEIKQEEIVSNGEEELIQENDTQCSQNEQQTEIVEVATNVSFFSSSPSSLI